MIKLPKSIRVAHMDFAIEEWSPVIANANHRWGEFALAEQTIRVHVSDRQFYEVLATLLHELTHAICWAYTIRLGKRGDTEERMVSTMAVAWAQIYRDNPELISFIATEGRDDRESMDEYAARKRREASGDS